MGKEVGVGALLGRSTTRVDAKPPMFAGKLQRSRRSIASSGLEQSNIPRATSRVCSLRTSYTGITGSNARGCRVANTEVATRHQILGPNKRSKRTRVCEYGGMRPACKLHTCSFPLAGTARRKRVFKGCVPGIFVDSCLQDVFCVARVSDRILTVLVRVILSSCGG